MCGIFAYIGSKDRNQLIDSFLKLVNRGPDFSILESIQNGVFFGFHRLAIIGMTETSHQPLKVDQVQLICNGEIYNYKQLNQEHQFSNPTQSDCEVILPLYLKYGFETAMKKLDAEFTCVMLDQRQNKLYIGRDPIGIRPLFIGYNTFDQEVGFSSEMKGLHQLFEKVEQFKPGHWMVIDLVTKDRQLHSYYSYQYKIDPSLSYDTLTQSIHQKLTQGVIKRLMSDRPLGCLLSGGVDSSIICSIACRYVDHLDCFTIGLEGSSDVIAAKKVVKFLVDQGRKITHHIVPFTVQTGLEAIPDVIKSTETFDCTTIRASTCQYLLAKYIRENTNIKVLLCGEISDEAFGSYQYEKNAPDAKSLHDDTCRLMKELHLFDVLRTDRTLATWGLEARVPFGDLDLVSTIMTMNPEYKLSKTQMEKKILRDAFNNGTYLPHDVLYRVKHAFSDAVSSKTESWKDGISHLTAQLVTNDQFDTRFDLYPHATPLSKEQFYYRQLFSKYYPQRETCLPYQWMPRFQDQPITDPSATILDCFTSSD